MTTTQTNMAGIQAVLEQKRIELIHLLQTRDGITIEKSADQLDEIQFASERDMAIRNVDRESKALRLVDAALRRAHEGSFGVCIECDDAISPKRLSAAPWAARCIQCQEVADREGQVADQEPLFNAA